MNDLEQKPKKTSDPIALNAFWQKQIKASKKVQKWERDGAKVVKKYRDETELVEDVDESSKSRFCILWSNVQVLRPALYSRQPKPEVERRHKDSERIARLAGDAWQRAVSYALEDFNFNEQAICGIDDYLLPGRGVLRVVYDPTIEVIELDTPVQALEGKLYDMAGNPVEAKPKDVISTPNGFSVRQVVEQVTDEKAVVQYVYWKDFRHSSARTWDRVWWVAFRSHLDKTEFSEKFGKELAEKVPYDTKPEGSEEEERPDGACAEVWEIWDKRKKQVLYIAKGFDRAFGVKQDPLRLKGFFPCGRPLLANLVTDSLTPRPDFCFYQTQANAVEEMEARRLLLIDALRVAGVYDSSMEGLSRLLSEATENQMIPVDSWAVMAEKGGLKGVVDFFPLEMVANVLQQLTVAQNEELQRIYELTGLSDIIRGASDPSDTATAQQIKGQFATLRISTRQEAVQAWCRDGMALLAEVIAEHFDPTRLRLMSGYDTMPGANPQDPEEWPAIVQVLRDDPSRRYRLALETDSTLAVNDQAEKQRVNEYTEVVGRFLGNVIPLTQQAPELAHYMGETLKFVSRRYRAGRQMEEALEQGINALIQRITDPQPPPPDPKAQAMMMKEQNAQAQLQLKAQSEQENMQLRQQEIALKNKEIDTNAAIEAQSLQVEAERIRQEMEMRILEFQNQTIQTIRDLLKERNEATQKVGDTAIEGA